MKKVRFRNALGIIDRIPYKLVDEGVEIVLPFNSEKVVLSPEDPRFIWSSCSKKVKSQVGEDTST